MQFIDRSVAYLQRLHDIYTLKSLCLLRKQLLVVSLILDIYIELSKFFFLFAFGCNKYHCLQHVGNYKPGSDSEMVNLSNQRLVENIP